MRTHLLLLSIIVSVVGFGIAGCGDDTTSGCDNMACNNACVAAGSASGACSAGACQCFGGPDADADADADADGDGDADAGDADGDADSDAEEGDDGDSDAGPICGNGVVEAPEECDDNGAVGCDGCSSTCTWEYSLVAGDGGQAHVPDSASLAALTGAHTIEAWVLVPTYILPSSGAALGVVSMPRSASGTGFIIEVHGGSGSNLAEAAFSDGTDHCWIQAAISPGWHHFAAQITPPGTLAMFVDGRVPVGSTSGGTCNNAWVARRQGVYVGNEGIGGSSYREPIDDVRVSSGARYAAPFTPTYELAADADTVLLLHFDEVAGPALDSSGNGNDASIAAPASRTPRVPLSLGENAILFGPGGGANAPASASFTAMSGSATMEAWVEFPETLLPAADHGILSMPRSATGAGFDLWATASGASNIVRAAVFAEPACRCDCVVAGWPVPAGWHHIAYVWATSSLSMYVDGSQVCTAACACATPPHPQGLFIGKEGVPASSSTFPYPIDEVRISSVARYSSAFTPPTEFAPDATTVALYHFDDPSASSATDSSGNVNAAPMTSYTYVPYLGCW